MNDDDEESTHVLQCDDLLPLAMVMLFDFQDRGFLMHDRSAKEGEEPLQEVRDLEHSLQRCVFACVCVFVCVCVRVVGVGTC